LNIEAEITVRTANTTWDTASARILVIQQQEVKLCPRKGKWLPGKELSNYCSGRCYVYTRGGSVKVLIRPSSPQTFTVPQTFQRTVISRHLALKQTWIDARKCLSTDPFRHADMAEIGIKLE
jgi:hypothetical protein